jgi:hypothetical protein
MSQDLTLDQTLSVAFASNMRLRPQQLQSRLVPAVLADLGFMDPGDMFTSEFQGTSEPQPRTGRAPKSPEGFVEEERRVAAFMAFDDGKFIDSIDKANKLADPTNGTMRAMIAGKERARDRMILQAMLAPARQGRTGETSVPFPAGQVIGVNNQVFYRGRADSVTAPGAANTPLTPAKLRAASELLDESEMPGERYIAVCSEDLQNMLTSVEVTSSDFQDVKNLVNGTINQFCGFNFVRLQKNMFAIPTANVRDLVCWVKDAVEYKSRDIEEASVIKREDRSKTPYAYYAFRHAALRAFDTGVVNVKVAF